MITSKMNSRVLKRFSFDLAWDLVFFTSSDLILDLKIIKTNILCKIHDDYFKNVTSRMLTRFSFDWAWWPSFWPQVWVFELDLEIIKTNSLIKIHDDYLKNEAAGVLTRFSFD